MTPTDTAIRELAKRNADVQVADIQRRGKVSFVIDGGVDIFVGEVDEPCCCCCMCSSCRADTTLNVTFRAEPPSA